MNVLHQKSVWRSALAGLAVGLALLSGCGRGPATAIVSGRVTHQGLPVTGGSITFVVAVGDNEHATMCGSLNPDGIYLLSDVPAGHARVAVETESVRVLYEYHKTAPPPGDKDQPPVPRYRSIPKKYSSPDTSGLGCEVSRGKNQDVDFDLP